MICITSLLVVMCMVWYLRRKVKHKQCFDKKESSAAADDTVVYDVPVFDNCDALMKCDETDGEMILHQNKAYEQVCTH